MSYITIDKGICAKPKFRKIARMTGLEDHVLLGYLCRIWIIADEIGHDLEGDDEDISSALSAPSALLCALCAVGWAERTSSGIYLNSNDPNSARLEEQRAQAKRDRARRSYERRMGREPDESAHKSAPVCASAPPASQPASLTSQQEEPHLAPTRDAKPPRSKPKDEIRWDHEVGWWGITDADRKAWSIAYPACDIDRQLARADQWLRSNPAKARKELWRKFLTGWMSRSQEAGGDIRSAKPATNGQHRKPTIDEKQLSIIETLNNAPSRRNA